ncbi:hypothetical protein JCM6882_003602 [Rhodosporidiobolus microsporus]
MAAPPQSSSFDEAWSAYAQAPPSAPSYAAARASQQYNAPYSTPFPETVDGGVMGPPTHPSDAYYTQSGGGGLRIDGHADPTYTFAPQRTLSHGTTPSPALPALSPASSLSTSSGFVSPQQFFSTGNSPEQRRSGLLPPASIQDAQIGGDGPYPGGGKGNPGWFAEMQETYLQQHSPQQPTSFALTHAPSVPPPSTPRRHAPTSSHLWRSPTVYSTTSSPTTSPYHRPTTPRAGQYRSDGPPSGRRGSTGGLLPDSPSTRGRSTPRRSQVQAPTYVDANGSPRKSVRRQAGLSIEVPQYGSPSPSRAPPPPQPVFAPANAEGGDSALSEASVREVEQLLGELGTILETGGSYELPPPPPQEQQQLPLHQRRVELVPPPSASRPRVPGGTYGYQQPVQAPPTSVFAPTSISISGVTLAEEDLALLDTPSLGGDEFYAPSSARNYPSSAPAWRTSFEMPPPPRPSQQQPGYDPSYYAAPPSPTYASASSYAAPPSLAPPQHFQHSHSQYSPQQQAPFRPSSAPRDTVPVSAMSPLAASVRRRRSSVDSAALAASASSSGRSHAYSPYPSTLGSNYAYSRQFQHPPHRHHVQEEQPRPQSQQQQFRRSLQHVPEPPHSPPAHPSWQQQQPRLPPGELPTVLQPAPPPRPDGATTPPPEASPAKGKGTGTPKATPKRKRASTAKPKPAVAMFINYSSADSKKLLNGVAPSGSTKKRREEEEAAAAAAAAAAAGGAPGPSSSTPQSSGMSFAASQ